MSYKTTLVFCFVFILFALGTSPAAQCVEDSTYDATVTTDSGSYRIPVEVEDNEVTSVHWPNGGNMHLYGAEIDGDEASGYDSRGNKVKVELDDLHDQEDQQLQYDEDDEEE